MKEKRLPNKKNRRASSDRKPTAQESGDSKFDRVGSSSVSSDDLSQTEWIEGMIEVVFKHPMRAYYLNPILNILEEKLGLEIDEDEAVGVKELMQKLIEYKLVRAEPTFSLPSLHTVLRELVSSFESIKSLRNRFATYYFPEGADLIRIAQELAQLPMVERAVPIPRLDMPSTVANEILLGVSDVLSLDDRAQDTQWYIFRCRVNEAWKMASGEGVVVADIDWGFRTTHRELRSRIELKHNSINGTEEVSRGLNTSHGTAVLGMVGAELNNKGIAGVAHKASLWAIQAGSSPILSRPRFWKNAIQFVCDHAPANKRTVIILEARSGNRNIEMVPSINQMIREAIEANIVVCVPAGNGDKNAGLDILGHEIPPTGSILVGATKYHESENRRTDLSNWGERITVSAPGDEFHDLTCGIITDDDYTNRFGQTSGAAPKVAGTVALMLQVNPTLTPAQVKEILIAEGGDVISDPAKPAGRFLNAEAAVREAKRRR